MTTSFFFCASTAARACVPKRAVGVPREQARIQLDREHRLAGLAGLGRGVEQELLLCDASEIGRSGFAATGVGSHGLRLGAHLTSMKRVSKRCIGGALALGPRRRYRSQSQKIEPGDRGRRACKATTSASCKKYSGAMQTQLADFIRDTPEGQEADAILRKCVHCGFCTATCPTYQVLGDDLDSPRGRIYLIKRVLEGAPVTDKTRLHLDRCLTCRACETTCPSGVQYGRLVDIGREVVEATHAARSLGSREARGALLRRAAQRAVRRCVARWASWSGMAPRTPSAAGAWPAPRHARRMLVLARLRAAVARAVDQRRGRARARPHRRLAGRGARRRLLRRACAST